MKTVESGAILRLLEQLASGRSATKASIGAVKQLEQGRERFQIQRKKIEESIERGARLTKHRITL